MRPRNDGAHHGGRSEALGHSQKPAHRTLTVHRRRCGQRRFPNHLIADSIDIPQINRPSERTELQCAGYYRNVQARVAILAGSAPDPDHQERCERPFSRLGRIPGAPRLSVGTGPCQLWCQHRTTRRLRRSLIISRMRRNRSLGTATSAIWKIVYLAWVTTLAPIFTPFSRSDVSDHFAISGGRARVRRKLAML